MIEIRTYEEFDSWLACNYDFVDGCIPEIILDPLSITVGWTEEHYLAKIIADFPDVKIKCGNMEFTGEEWKQIM